jgi:hypothetical protein
MKLVLLALTLVGCANMPGAVKQYESKTDGAKHIYMEPGWVGSKMKVGLHRTSDMPKGEVNMIVAVYLNAPDPKNGLTINIDGEKTTFSAIDQLSDVDENHFFHKRYTVKEDFLRKMVAGKSVWMRVNHIGQTYSEGEFSRTGISTGKDGFVKFLNEVSK